MTYVYDIQSLPYNTQQITIYQQQLLYTNTHTGEIVMGVRLRAASPLLDKVTKQLQQTTTDTGGIDRIRTPYPYVIDSIGTKMLYLVIACLLAGIQYFNGSEIDSRFVFFHYTRIDLLSAILTTGINALLVIVNTIPFFTVEYSSYIVHCKKALCEKKFILKECKTVEDIEKYITDIYMNELNLYKDSSLFDTSSTTTSPSWLYTKYIIIKPLLKQHLAFLSTVFLYAYILVSSAAMYNSLYIVADNNKLSVCGVVRQLFYIYSECNTYSKNGDTCVWCYVDVDNNVVDKFVVKRTRNIILPINEVPK